MTQRRLLAMFAVQARRPIRPERLADDLQMSPGSLRTSVSRLRKLLGAEVLQTDAVGYRLDTDVDSELFYQVLTRPADTDRLAQLEEALGFWRGPAIEEFAEEPWARAESARLNELHAAAVEEHAAQLLTFGRWPDAIAAMERHVADHPLRDRPRGLLMQALAGSGRQAEALAVYRTHRAYLDTEVGTEPSAEVRDIGRRIAEGGDGSALITRAPAARATLSSDLPRYRSSLIGRDDDLVVLAAHVQTARLLTLSGVGGVGKSRLAVALAHREKQSGRATWFVELAALHDAAGIVSAIAHAVGSGATDDAVVLARYLSERSGLLVIDNCEHVLDAVADVIDAISASCPGIAIVATSREFLALEGEQIFQVRPLDPMGAGADLLLTRAHAAGASIESVEREVAEEICARLDGLPLAIEIAATRAGTLGLRALLASLEDRFTLLAAGQRRGIARQQTIGKAIDWSYQLLTPDKQRLFRRLAIFSGGFELDAAADVAERLGYAGREVPLLVSALVSRSMVDVNLRPAVTRYRILEPLRAFALEALADAEETDEVAGAHAAWIGGLTDISMEVYYSRGCHEVAVRLERELDNLRGALDPAHVRGDGDLTRQLCGAPTCILLLSHPQLAGAVIRLDPLLARTDERRSAVASSYGSRAISTLSGDDMNRSLAVYGDCDPTGRLGARQLVHSGYLMVSAGDADGALALLREAIADPAAPPETVDYMVTIAIFAACAVSRRDLLDPSWVSRARVAAEHSDVPATRLLARRVLASALATTDPAESREWTRRALDDHEALPLLERRISIATWSVLWDSESPALAAQRMRELLVEHIAGGHGDDQTVLVACAALLARYGHSCADDVIATLAKTAGAGRLAISLPDVASHAARGTPLTSEALRRRLLSGLGDLAA
ncbi:MAG TPA: BTAD domain-containing putative transcriptional regulator [Frankiaceae bacterium]|nr:BTAD domain-containing putative transcriptional regulator [Frankiaceae bacterium]